MGLKCLEIRWKLLGRTRAGGGDQRNENGEGGDSLKHTDIPRPFQFCSWEDCNNDEAMMTNNVMRNETFALN